MCIYKWVERKKSKGPGIPRRSLIARGQGAGTLVNIILKLGLIKRGTYEQRLEEGEGMYYTDIWEEHSR